MSFANWPGAGPEPAEEAEGFRQEQIDAEETRKEEEEAAEKQRSEDLKKELSGEPDPPDPPATQSAPTTHTTSYDTSKS